MTNRTIPALSAEATLKRRLRIHLRTIGFQKGRDGDLKIVDPSKTKIRQLHQSQRCIKLKSHRNFIMECGDTLKVHFANGNEIDPNSVNPKLELIQPGTWQSNLFRLATLTWSVPVSNGFGRRLRYIIWDRHIDKIMGLIALGDPVFNLRARDEYIGWKAERRKVALINVMDAYILGAVPPYNLMIGGKVIACLARSKEVYHDFLHKYGKRTGLISGTCRSPKLAAITTTSALGRSSIYNRLKLKNSLYMRPIGFTTGWGHFHISDYLVEELRNYLRAIGHPYADGNRFGQGPNWRLRTIRAGLEALGLRPDLLNHSVRRELFISELAANARQYLAGEDDQCDISGLASADEVAEAAVERWLKPRAQRDASFRSWSREQISLSLPPLKSPNETAA